MGMFNGFADMGIVMVVFGFNMVNIAFLFLWI